MTDAEPTDGLSAKARRTRRRLMDAAIEEFAEGDYLQATVADITKRAGVAHGTFYTYFDSKEDIFREVALRMQRWMIRRRGDEPGDGGQMSMADRIEAANRSYLEAYRDNASMMAVIEQVATFNDELRTIRAEIRHAFVASATRTIERLQHEGSASPDIDPRYAASALGSMVDRFAYVWFVLGEPFEFDEAVRSLTLLWTRAIGLSPPTGEA